MTLPSETHDAGANVASAHERGAFGPNHPASPIKAGSGGGHSHGLGGHDHTGGGGSGAAHTTAGAKHRKKLVIVLVITLSVFAVQVVGSLISGSLALLADAGHMLTDATGVFVALIATLIAARPATDKRTFGYLRVEVLAALINGLGIGAIAVVIFVEAIKRIGSEVDVSPGPMLIAATLGAIANLISLLVLQSGQKESLNIRGAYLEVLGDLLGSVAVIITGIIIWLTEWMLADQIASIVIALMIMPRAWSLLSEVVHVLMESTPKGLDLDETRTHLLSVPGVVDVHHMHAWTITSGVTAFTAHVTITDETMRSTGTGPVLAELLACLDGHFDTAHSTLQIESECQSALDSPCVGSTPHP